MIVVCESIGDFREADSLPVKLCKQLAANNQLHQLIATLLFFGCEAFVGILCLSELLHVSDRRNNVISPHFLFALFDDLPFLNSEPVLYRDVVFRHLC